MAMSWKLPFIAALMYPAGVAAETAPESGNAVFDQTVELVEERFYAPAELDDFPETVRWIIDRYSALSENDANPSVVTAAIDDLLASLETSHTARYTPDSVDYYELVDVFRYGMRDHLRRLFPPKGRVTYEGIGIATREIDGKTFVSDVYDGGPADRAGIKMGDEILAADGEPFEEIGSFRGKAGERVRLSLRRTPGGPEMTRTVRVEELQPSETLLEAIEESARVIEHDGHRIGYIRIWSYTRDEVEDILNQALGGGRLADTEGLVLDLRSRWGGAPADAAEIIVGDTPEMQMIERNGDKRYLNTRWRKHVVAIIDEGTRSGMEIFANALQVNDVPLVGTPTAGAVVGGSGFRLPDDSLLVLALVDVRVAGERLEGNPVEPDIAVPFDFRYANGADPQLDAALDEMARQLSEG